MEANARQPSQFALRFLGEFDPASRREARAFARWIRARYEFPYPLEIRLFDCDFFSGASDSDFDMCWWQSERCRERVVVELAVGLSLARESVDESVAGSGLLASIGVALKTYYQSVDNSTFRSDSAARWGDQLLEAYVHGTPPPSPRRGRSW